LYELVQENYAACIAKGDTIVPGVTVEWEVAPFSEWEGVLGAMGVGVNGL